jgi:transcriptional regulator with XRE-family HTH domain
MPDYPDNSPEALEIAEGQRIRLRRLREVFTPVQAEAARLANVSRFAWNKMELGRARVNAVALTRYCMAYRIPTEYVMTGSYEGLPAEIASHLQEMERMDAEIDERRAEQSGADTSGPEDCEPSRSSRQKSNPGMHMKPAV